MLLEHFYNQLYGNMRYEISKDNIDNVLDAGRRADQLREAYAMHKRDFVNNRDIHRDNKNQFYGGQQNVKELSAGQCLRVSRENVWKTLA